MDWETRRRLRTSWLVIFCFAVTRRRIFSRFFARFWTRAVSALDFKSEMGVRGGRGETGEGVGVAAWAGTGSGTVVAGLFSAIFGITSPSPSSRGGESEGGSMVSSVMILD